MEAVLFRVFSRVFSDRSLMLHKVNTQNTQVLTNSYYEIARLYIGTIKFKLSQLKTTTTNCHLAWRAKALLTPSSQVIAVVVGRTIG